jgi:hypothetical protein
LDHKSQRCKSLGAVVGNKEFKFVLGVFRKVKQRLILMVVDLALERNVGLGLDNRPDKESARWNTR